MRRSFALLIVIAAVTTLAGTTAAVQVDPVPNALECTAQDVLLLIDRSSSLNQTDPERHRVDAATQLVDLIAPAAAPLTPITVSLSAFGTKVDPPSTFALPAERDAAVKAIQGASVAVDRNTDYVFVLGEAGKFAAGEQSGHCRSVVWFTDGAYDLEDAAPAAEYTELTDPDDIRKDLGNQVCGPLSTTSKLPTALAAQLSSTGVRVDLVDLNTERRPSSKRDETKKVLDRMFGPADDPCHVEGSRHTVDDADELADQFVAQAQAIIDRAEKAFDDQQLGAGRHLIDCARLEGGVPAGLVVSVGASGELPSTPVTITLPTGNFDAPSHDMTSAEREHAGLVSAHAATGSLRSCWIDVNATATLIGSPHIWPTANATPVGVAVGGPGSDHNPALGLGDDVVDITATTPDGRELAMGWNTELRQWETQIPGPRSDPLTLQVKASLKEPVVDDELSPVPPLTIPVNTEPSSPSVSWTGTSSIEGARTVDGELVVTPRSVIGGQLCIDIGHAAASLADGDGHVVGELTAAPEKRCEDDSGPFSIPATITIDDPRNAHVTGKVGYTAHYVDPDGTPIPVVTEAADVDLDLTKAADTGRWVSMAVLLAGGSALVSAIAFWLLTRRQSRLPDPRDFVAVDVPVTSADDGSFVSSLDGGVRMQDLRPVAGSRSRFDLPDGIAVERRTPLNPFANTSAQVTTSNGTIDAVPALGVTKAGGRRCLVTNRFRTLFILRHTGVGSSGVLLMPRGTTPSVADRSIDKALGTLSRGARRVAPVSVDQTAPPAAESSTARPSMTGPESAPALPDSPDPRPPRLRTPPPRPGATR